MIVSIIAALDKNRVIGNENKMPWRLPADMQRFVSLTKGKPVIMGRKTYESIGKALSDRKNIILTGDKNFLAVGCFIAHNVDEALRLALGYEEVMVIGGATVYKQFAPLADRFYLTYIKESFEGDAKFPSLLDEDLVETHREEHKADDKNKYDYTFVTLERRK